MVATPVLTRAVVGLQAHPVTVECHIAAGLPRTTIVGLAEGAVKESRDRINSALRTCGFHFPRGHVIVNLAPSHLTKSGSSYDLPIALAILCASDQIEIREAATTEFVGELGLFGEIRRINGLLSCALACQKAHHALYLPKANELEASLIKQGKLRIAGHLLELCAHLNGKPQSAVQAPKSEPVARHRQRQSTYEQILGQSAAKRASLIAEAGGHHLLMVGPPGTGKTLLAKGLAELLPPLTDQQMLEVAAVYSAAGISRPDYHDPPFREPHHSATDAALLGGGQTPTPGESALAHHGVLFLDELPHFRASAIDLLREPLESGVAVISRARYKVRYPCRFQLVAAMNPCPAGRICSETSCRCAPNQVQRYQSRISGPLLDRIDLQVRVPQLRHETLTKLERRSDTRQSIKFLRQRVESARLRQLDRQGHTNSWLDAARLRSEMTRAGLDESFLTTILQKFQLSARSYHKVWRIARTIADLDEKDAICQAHVVEALGFRSLPWEQGVR
tara:strand:+ start:1789 stop:3309 length:1521 start_codon:yes stop_codon:yes gene_type:complete